MNSGEITFELHPRQLEALTSQATELLYGGAASGGKSHISRIMAITWALQVPGIQIYFFRRLYDDLIKNHLEGPTGFRAMLAPWCNGRHPKSPLIAGRLCEIVEGEIRFWNGSRIFLCHLQHQKDITKYYGVEIHVLFLEEATQFSEFMIRFLRSRLRIPDTLQIPKEHMKPKHEWTDPKTPSYYFPRIVYTSNPGGIGHGYIKKAFIQGFKPYEMHKAPDTDGGHIRQFIPARVDDNPSVNREEVKANLAGLPHQLVDALLNGNWNAIVGAFFPEIDLAKHLIPAFKIPDHWTRLMAMDWGACGEGDPFSIGWYAVSDGVNTPYPRNSLICYKSWYGAGLPKVTASAVAKGIKERELGDKPITSRWAGGDIEQKRGHGPSIFEIFANEGIYFLRADQRRQPGHLQFRERLVGKNGRPMIYWFEQQQIELETIMNLQHDPYDANDCTDNDDHVYEQARYMSMARPWAQDLQPKELPFEQQFKAPTINELWELKEQMNRSRF